MDKSQYKRYSKEGRNASNRMTVCNNKLKDAQEKMKNEKKKREKYTGPTVHSTVSIAVYQLIIICDVWVHGVCETIKTKKILINNTTTITTTKTTRVHRNSKILFCLPCLLHKISSTCISTSNNDT